MSPDEDSNFKFGIATLPGMLFYETFEFEAAILDI